LWEVGFGLGGYIVRDGGLLAGYDILGGVEFGLRVLDGQGMGRRWAYKMESELKRSQRGDEDQEDEVDGDITDTLSHPSGRHLDLEGGNVVSWSMLCVQEEGISSSSDEGEQGRLNRRLVCSSC
jgi:hypothetical protein